MTRFDGSAAFKLDFGSVTTTGVTGGGRSSLRLATPSGVLRGPDKYKMLDHQRRQAQIKARRLLDMMEEG
jgi:hypothetical protein